MTEFELKIILKIQSVSNKFLDYLMFGLTQLGGEIFFIAVAVVLLWCINKRDGFKFLNVYFMGQILVAGLKILFKRPRPYTAHDSVRPIIEETSGYSLPSGHSQSIANISTQLALMLPRHSKNPIKLYRIIVWTGIALTFIIAFTRVYLGQHYPTDTFMGIILGVIGAIFFCRLFELLKDKEELLFIVILPLSAVVAALVIGLSLSEDIVKITGVYGAVTLGYFIEKRYVKYNVKSGKLYKHILKLILGGVILFGIKEGLKIVGSALELQGRVLLTLDYFRYFIIGTFASLIAPMLFKRIKI